MPELIVGSPRFDALGASDLGIVHVVSGANGSPIHSWSGQGPGDWFGSAVSTAGDINGDGLADFIAGAYRNDSGGTDSGHARVFLADAFLPTAYCTAKTNSLGCAPQVSFTGAPSAPVGDNFHVTADNTLNFKSGLLIWSYGFGSIPLGGATLCLSPPIRRTSIQNSGGLLLGSNCTGAFDFHFSHTYMASLGVAAGDTLYAQYWSRDPGFAAPSGINLTSALVFDVYP